MLSAGRDPLLKASCPLPAGQGSLTEKRTLTKVTQLKKNISHPAGCRGNSGRALGAVLPEMAEKDAANISSNLHDVCPPGRSLALD